MNTVASREWVMLRWGLSNEAAKGEEDFTDGAGGGVEVW